MKVKFPWLKFDGGINPRPVTLVNQSKGKYITTIIIGEFYQCHSKFMILSTFVDPSTITREGFDGGKNGGKKV